MIESQIHGMTAQRRERAAALRLFDANLWLGPPEGFPLATELDVTGLIGAMRDHFITGGLVSHWYSKLVSPADGNIALNDLDPALTEHGLFTIATCLPVLSGEEKHLPGLTDLPPLLGGVRLFPKIHSFPLADWTIGKLCRWMIERSLPLFIWHTEVNWQDLHALAGTFPELRIVIESQTRKIIYQAHALISLLRERPNTFVEISNLTAPCFEETLRVVGPERLVFGSFLPMNDPFVPLGILLDTDMPDADRLLIAGNNLRRLLGVA